MNETDKDAEIARLKQLLEEANNQTLVMLQHWKP